MDLHAASMQVGSPADRDSVRLQQDPQWVQSKTSQRNLRLLDEFRFTESEISGLRKDANDAKF